MIFWNLISTIPCKIRERGIPTKQTTPTQFSIQMTMQNQKDNVTLTNRPTNPTTSDTKSGDVRRPGNTTRTTEQTSKTTSEQIERLIFKFCKGSWDCIHNCGIFNDELQQSRGICPSTDWRYGIKRGCSDNVSGGMAPSQPDQTGTLAQSHSKWVPRHDLTRCLEETQQIYGCQKPTDHWL